MEEAAAWATAEVEITGQDLAGAWDEETAGAGAMGWATAGAVGSAEDKGAARDTDTDMARECLHGVPRLGTLSTTAGGNN